MSGTRRQAGARRGHRRRDAGGGPARAAQPERGGANPAAQRARARWPWLLAAALIVAAVALFLAPALRGEFTNWDDDVNVTGNPLLTEQAGGARLARIWGGPYRNLYIPLTYTSYLADLAVGGGRPAAFHLGNIVLHAAASVGVLLLLGLLLRADRGGARPGRGALVLAASAGAVVFALHPVQVEPVAWITGRKDVLSGALAVWAWVAYVAATPPEGRVRPWVFAAALAALAASLLAKPAAITLPLAMAAADVAVRRAGWRRTALRVSPFLAVGAAMALVTAGAQVVPEELARRVAPWMRPAVAGDALLFYAGKLAWPADLAPVYGRVPWEVPPVPGHLVLLVVAVLLAAGAWMRARWWAGPAVFVAGLLPVLGFAPFLFQIYSTVADRYLYLPMTGVALGATLGAAWVLRRWARAVVPLAVVVVAAGCVLGVLSARQTAVWRDSLGVWTRALRVAPGVAESHNNMGIALAMAGRDAEAFTHFSEAVRLKPHYADALNNYAIGLMDRGRAEEARRIMEGVVADRPRGVQGLITLGNAHAALGDAEAAATSYLAALAVEPRRADARYNLALARIAQERLGEAETLLRDVVRADPRHREGALTLGGVLERLGRPAEAAGLYRGVLATHPRDAEAAKGLARTEAAGRGDGM